MREVSYWEADDGTVFEDESECLEYEWKQNVEAISDQFILLDGRYKKLDPTDTASYDNCYFIFLMNEQAGRKLKNIWDCDVTSVYPPDFINTYKEITPGLWAFDESCDEWYHLGERIAELQDMADECMETINGG